jgi:hypothetical protein
MASLLVKSVNAEIAEEALRHLGWLVAVRAGVPRFAR